MPQQKMQTTHSNSDYLQDLQLLSIAKGDTQLLASGARANTHPFPEIRHSRHSRLQIPQ
jgi:hypothetical protein